MTTSTADVAARIEQVPPLARWRTRGVFRRLGVELRADVARAFVGKTVTVTTRHERSYSGEVVTVAGTTDGNVSHMLVIREPGYWPIAVSLATIDSITEAPQ